jgi:hypothetical protein
MASRQTPPDYDSVGRLVGPRGMSRWKAWREARNKAIENPRRLSRVDELPRHRPRSRKP